MASSKSKVKNAFQLYCEEQRQIRKLAMTMCEAVDFFHEEWKDKPDEFKTLYKLKAKQWKEDHKIVKEQDELHNKRKVEKPTTTALEQLSNWMYQDFEKLIHYPMYFISVLHCYKEAHSNIYHPIEIGIVRFTIRAGYIGKYHTFPKPDLPLGALGEAHEYAERTHKINAVGHPEFCDNPFSAWMSMLDFINPYDGDLPLLFAREEDVRKVTSSLVYLSSRAHAPPAYHSTLTKKVVPFQDAIENLLDHHNKLNGKTNVKNTLYHLLYHQMPMYEYSDRIKCHFHGIEANPHCALHIAHSMGNALTNILHGMGMMKPTPAHYPHKNDLEHHTSYGLETNNVESDSDDESDGDSDGPMLISGNDEGMAQPAHLEVSPLPTLGRGKTSISTGKQTVPTFKSVFPRVGIGRGISIYTKPVSLGRGMTSRKL